MPLDTKVAVGHAPIFAHAVNARVKSAAIKMLVPDQLAGMSNLPNERVCQCHCAPLLLASGMLALPRANKKANNLLAFYDTPSERIGTRKNPRYLAGTRVLRLLGTSWNLFVVVVGGIEPPTLGL